MQHLLSYFLVDAVVIEYTAQTRFNGPFITFFKGLHV
jgi:hypothetical protein